MALSQTSARQAVQRARNGSLKDLGDVLSGIVEGDLRPEHDLVALRARSTFVEDFLAASVDARFS